MSAMDQAAAAEGIFGSLAPDESRPARNDLLASLKETLRALELNFAKLNPDYDGTAAENSVIGRARAAIAKAEGEANLIMDLVEALKALIPFTREFAANECDDPKLQTAWAATRAALAKAERRAEG